MSNACVNVANLSPVAKSARQQFKTRPTSIFSNQPKEARRESQSYWVFQIGRMLSSVEQCLRTELGLALPA